MDTAECTAGLPVVSLMITVLQGVLLATLTQNAVPLPPPVQQDDEEVERVHVDLSAQEYAEAPKPLSSHVLSRAWYENVRLSGFGAVGFLDSGATGTRPNGGFIIKETSLFLEADAWEDSSFFFELQVNRLGKDDALFVRTGEVHARFHDVLWRRGEHPISIKVGRIDIPFGEEYLWQDSTDNPLITQSAPYPYGYDEGVAVFGRFASGGSWIASLTDGNDDRSAEDDPAKAVTAKVGYSVIDDLYLSASVMINGDSKKSALEFGGSHFEPVGAGGAPSTLGASPSEKINAYLWQIDATYTLRERAALSFFYGQGKVDDDVNAFDRSLAWCMLQPSFSFTPNVRAVLRYSAIGTFDDGEGYHFDGKILAGGNAAFGYDARSLRRLSGGIVWSPNPRSTFKIELGQDWFDLIGGSPFDEGNGDRLYFGVEAVLSF